MKIIALLENTTKHANIGCEHGLSLYIDTGSHKILFDMGQSDLFYENAKKLGVDLSLVDIAIISHGHNDHGGGLKTFLEIKGVEKVRVINRYDVEGVSQELFEKAVNTVFSEPQVDNASATLDCGKDFAFAVEPVLRPVAPG